MASIFKINTGNWAYRVDIGIDPATGKRKQKYKSGFTSQKKAQLAAAQIQIELATKDYIPDKNVTFEEFAKEWLTIYANEVKEQSYLLRKKQLKVLNKHLGKLPIQDIEHRRYQNLLVKLSKSYAYNTLSGIHATACLILKKAVQFKVIAASPAKYATIPRQKESAESSINRKKYLEKEELLHLLNIIRQENHYQDYVLFLLLAYTGLRIGEACALQWSDIDFINQTVSITKTIYNDNNVRNFTLGTPKTKQSIRIIAVDEEVLDVLKKHRAKQKEYRLAHANTFTDHNAIFTSRKFPGYPLNRTAVDFKMKYYLKKAKLPLMLTPHSLRHTHVSLLAEAGVDLYEIMERLGHLNDITTRSIYLHTTKNRRRNASDKFAQLLRTHQ